MVAKLEKTRTPGIHDQGGLHLHNAARALEQLLNAQEPKNLVTVTVKGEPCRRTDEGAS